MLNINFCKSQRDIVTYLLAAESYPVAAAEASHQRVKPSPAEDSLSTHPAGGVAPRRGDISVSPTRGGHDLDDIARSFPPFPGSGPAFRLQQL